MRIFGGIFCVVLLSFRTIYRAMSMSIDWKRSMVLTIILIAVFYGLQYVIDNRQTLCIVTIVIFVVVLVIGNLKFLKSKIG